MKFAGGDKHQIAAAQSVSFRFYGVIDIAAHKIQNFVKVVYVLIVLLGRVAGVVQLVRKIDVLVYKTKHTRIVTEKNKICNIFTKKLQL